MPTPGNPVGNAPLAFVRCVKADIVEADIVTGLFGPLSCRLWTVAGEGGFLGEAHAVPDTVLHNAKGALTAIQGLPVQMGGDHRQRLCPGPLSGF